MADQKRTDADRLGTSTTDAATGLGGSATPTGGIDPATSTISSTPGTYTGRESVGGSSSAGASGTGTSSYGSAGLGSASGSYGPSYGSEGSGGGSMTDRTRQQASNLASQARQQASGLAGKAKQALDSQFSGQKERATESLGGISEALRQTSQTFRGSDQEMIAGYIEDAATYVDRLSGYLQNRSLNDLMREGEMLARREPALFIGGAFVIGLLGARFLKASRADAYDYNTGSYGYSTGGSYGTGSGMTGGYGSGMGGSSFGTGYSGGSYTGGSLERTSGSMSGGSMSGNAGTQDREEGFGSYVPGGVAGDYTRTHAFEKSRTGSAADEALGDEARTASTNDREGF